MSPGPATSPLPGLTSTMVNPEAVVREVGCVAGLEVTSPREQTAAISRARQINKGSICFMPPMITQIRQ